MLWQALEAGSEVYPVKEGDFLPYASAAQSYWTGYFSSRPAVKLQERIGARDLAVTRQVGVMRGIIKIFFHQHIYNILSIYILQYFYEVLFAEFVELLRKYFLSLRAARSRCCASLTCTA